MDTEAFYRIAESLGDVSFFLNGGKRHSRT